MCVWNSTNIAVHANNLQIIVHTYLQCENRDTAWNSNSEGLSPRSGCNIAILNLRIVLFSVVDKSVWSSHKAKMADKSKLRMSTIYFYIPNIIGECAISFCSHEFKFIVES